ncbi:T9SS type A sorting domain-containing protein [Tunicatimonas pelagia]|uniref:T9SS type A sorting domain-containing protein n=1 Tax=Tunicatimonas pelagia TaxID=931531 RepID=UPI0026670B6B|nr:T9SS type A sorting domain-containing protein [Tunicatimonas pelagia]WKN45469.1 T9SS type A sorting domain-containing protein [Tunicatimonas pelagia]
MKTTQYLLMSGLLLISTLLYAQQPTITVDVSRVKTNIGSKGAGYCTSFLTDNINIQNSLKTTRAKTLRFPMGGLAENYLFHNPAKYKTINQGLEPVACTRNSGAGGDINPDLTYKNTMDFDEFMDLCDATNTEPVVMVSVRGFKLAGSNITREQLKQNAVEWVKYAKSRNYKVKYWEIGNEVELDHSQNSGGRSENFDMDEYVALLKEFSKAMKSVDGSIKVGAGITNDPTWYRAVIEGAVSETDFLVAHQYHTSDSITNFGEYSTNRWKYISSTEKAIQSINQYAKGNNRQRLKVMVTEHSSFAPNPMWVNQRNEIYKSLYTFEQIANMFSYDDRVLYTHFWVTTNPWGNRGTVDDADAFDKNNKWKILNQGRIVQVFNQFLGAKMLDVQRVNGFVRAYASYTPSTKALTVYLLNKKSGNQSVKVNMANYSGRLSGERWVYQGKDTPAGRGPYAIDHTWRNTGDIWLNNNQVSLTLPRASITVLRFRAINARQSAEVDKPINEVSEAPSVELFANPASDQVQLQVKNAAQVQNLYLTDLSGRITKVHYQTVAGDKLVISTSQLNDGVYILHGTIGTQTFTERLIIKR